LSGFIALFILWACQSFIIDQNNKHILSTKVAQIFNLGNSYISIIFITAVVGAFVAGCAALTGSFLRQPPAKPKRK